MLKGLEKVNWLAPQKQIPAFTSAGIKHCFGGIKEGYEKADNLKQVHETSIIEASSELTAHELTERAHADGLYTLKVQEKIAVRSADCLPILYACRKKSIAIAVHSGWRSLTGGIPAKALEVYEEQGGKLENIIIGLGPSIGIKNFEVGPEVKEAIQSKSLGLSPEQADVCLKKGQRDRWHVNLQAAAAFSLINYGVPGGSINIINACTFGEVETWHSYRREGKDCEMNWSWIEL